MTEESELFAAEPGGASAAYTNVRAADHQPLIDAKAHCEELWADFKPLADRQFLDRFPFEFHQRWFEMYTAAALKRAGFEVHSADAGPDIQTSIDGRRVWIECVCATCGEPGRPDSVPERVVTKLGDPPVVTRVPHEKVVLRLRNSLREKADKYTTYLKNGVVKPDDLLVVALNVHAIPHAWPDMEDFMMRSLYGVGNIVIRMSRDTGEVHVSETTLISFRTSRRISRGRVGLSSLGRSGSSRRPTENGRVSRRRTCETIRIQRNKLVNVLVWPIMAANCRSSQRAYPV